MEKKNQAGNLLPMQVTDNLSVAIVPDPNHEFIMETYQVAYGYGISASCLRSHYSNHKDELIEGKHFVVGVHILDSKKRFAHNKIFWTKRGIVRLGFFIKSERARLFRDWAEELVINAVAGTDAINRVSSQKGELPAKRNHNRLSPDRLLSIMADVCQIDDKALRISISSKLMNGGLA
ncbi:MAG: hypothetical protein A2066_18810 [Bacteroidetes bacterium GWB2_41_8]|nr:MAG: hypothetical protein A2066_18810 [Bacteroidetes bacterium GWB2_41_8]